MWIPRTNLVEQLLRHRNQQLGEVDILRQVRQALALQPKALRAIQENLANGSGQDSNCFDIDLLEASRIFHINHIKQICIDYRLRFLDTKYFKAELPPAAIFKIEQLQNAHKTELEGFKIMAPSRLFKLEDKDDPLLFAPIGNGYYYLIHQWGNDLHPLRKFLVWPFKNIGNLTLLILLISYLVTMLVPDGLFSTNQSNAEFWLVFFFMFKSIGAVVIFYGFALGKNFNPVIWNSKYFN